jgi:hypothetical protein
VWLKTVTHGYTQNQYQYTLQFGMVKRTLNLFAIIQIVVCVRRYGLSWLNWFNPRQKPLLAATMKGGSFVTGDLAGLLMFGFLTRGD